MATNKYFKFQKIMQYSSAMLILNATASWINSLKHQCISFKWCTILIFIYKIAWILFCGFLIFSFRQIFFFFFEIGLSGDRFHFNSNGDGPARYNIIHFKQVQPGKYRWIKVGEYYEGELRLNMDGEWIKKKIISIN